ncbi:hypothetical protein L596_028750 [Steinernema carpocapsae]|uniref:Tudor domain-containing protein n=1 Tax=Steinernema carpocapsae TaxID=34508 RepID=A0A4U5LZ90_STECR|nr:hypothetical protein L596_028750 [Steinernema carpocapsae]
MHLLDDAVMDQEVFDAEWYRLSNNMDQLKHDSADFKTMDKIYQLMYRLNCSIEGIWRQANEQPKAPTEAFEVHCGNIDLEDAIEGKEDDSSELQSASVTSRNPNLSEMAKKPNGALRYPKTEEWREDEEFGAKLISSASPLEFVVITAANQKMLEELNAKLDRRHSRLLKSRLPREKCVPHQPCLALHGERFHRALIMAVGFEDVHLKIVDSGRTLFSPFSSIFEIPSRYVNHAPPLASTCFLAGGDSRYMEAEFVDNFNEIVNRVSNLRVTATGVRHPRSGHPIVTLNCASSGEAIQCYNKNKIH